MSGVEGVVTEVLLAHARRIDPNHPAYGNCRCGLSIEDPEDHADHVAALVVQALGLTEEHGHDIEGRRKPNPHVLMGRDGRPSLVAADPPKGWCGYRRWVSPWVAVEREEP